MKGVPMIESEAQPKGLEEDGGLPNVLLLMRLTVSTSGRCAPATNEKSKFATPSVSEYIERP